VWKQINEATRIETGGQKKAGMDGRRPVMDRQPTGRNLNEPILAKGCATGLQVKMTKAVRRCGGDRKRESGKSLQKKKSSE